MTNNGMDVNVKDGYGNTALHLAAKHGHATSIKVGFQIFKKHLSLSNMFNTSCII